MLTDKQNVDQLFQVKLRDYEKTPPVFVWNRIESELNAHQRTRNIILLKWAGFAAAIIVAFMAGWWMTNPSVQSVIHENSITEIVKKKTDLQGSANDKQSLTQAAVSDISTSVVQNKVSHVQNASKEYKPAISSLASFAANTSFLSKNSGIPSMESKEPVLVDVEKEFLSHYQNNIQKLKKLSQWFYSFKNDSNHHDTTRESKTVFVLNKQYNTNDRSLFVPDSKKEAYNRNGKWIMSAGIAPVFTSGVGYNSASKTSVETSISGKMMAGYKIGKRVVIKSGIIYSQIKQVTTNVDFNSTGLASDFQVKTSRASTPSGDVSLNKSNAIKMELLYSRNNSLLTGYQADLTQEFGYIEIPAEVTYKIIDHKFNVGLTGGISTNLLVGNKAGLFENGQKINSGETNSLRDVTYSGAMGLAFGYNMGNGITFTVEPRIKHFLNSLSSNKAVEFKPYQLDIMTGVTYSFN
jgi:hypothetical protein